MSKRKPKRNSRSRSRPSSRPKKSRRTARLGGRKIKIDFISSDTLNKKVRNKRFDFILNKVRDGSILVTNGVMNSNDEMELIKETMRKVDNGFPGIEVASLKRETTGFMGFLESVNSSKERLQGMMERARGREYTPSLKTGITLIGPAKLIRNIKKNPDSFSILAER